MVAANISSRTESLRATIRRHKRWDILFGLLGIILTMTMVMMTALAVTRERERGTMENLLALAMAVEADFKECVLGSLS